MQTLFFTSLKYSVLEGCSAVILAYGQTGTGKTLTISGLQNSFQDRGIAPRIVADLFQQKQNLKEKYKVCIQISYIETTRSHIVDLLNKNEDSITALSNITIVKVHDIYNAMKVLFKAEGRRQIKNDSHSANGLLTFHVITKQINVTNAELKISKLHLVDLAGVDTYGNVTSLYKNVFEVGGANATKSQLEQFMLILCQNNPAQIKVKHRLNPMIQYLGDSLNGRSILRYIGHIRVDFDSLLITTSIFRFGQIVRGLKPLKLQNNVIEDKEAKYRLMEEQLEKSKIEKDIEVMITGHDLASNITQERIKHMQNVAEEYLQNKTNEIVLLNVSDATTVLQVFKNLYSKLENEKNEYMKAVFDKVADDKHTLTKTESNPSTKSSRRGSKSLKSKESLLTGSRTTSQSKRKSDKTSRSPTGSQPKLTEKNKIESPRASSIRRSRTSSLMRKSGSRRKSATSTTSIGTDANDQNLQDTNSTNVIPQSQEAWSEFIIEPEYRYPDLMCTLESCDAKAREARISYIEEVKKLQVLFDLVDLRKDELRRIQMQRLLHKDERIANVNNTENSCIENVKNANDELVAQQETVLKNQSLYRITIESYINAKRAINERFQLFCQEKYRIPMPPVDLQSRHSSEEALMTSMSLDAKAVAQTEPDMEVQRYEGLKRLMKQQMEKTLKRKEAKRKWIQSYKI